MAIAQIRSPILPLTSVRFFAAAYVVLHHSVLWTTGFSTYTWFGRFQRNGFVAVGFFFVLSGYILAHVYLNAGRTFQTKQFLISRFARIYPLLLFSLLVDIPRYAQDTVKSHTNFHVLKAFVRALPSFVLLQAWFGSRLLALNPPSWSLSAETFFYLMFPFIAFYVWSIGKRQGWRSIASIWACALALPILVTLLIPSLFTQVDTSPVQWVIVLSPLLRVFEFLAGIALCAIQNGFAGKLSVESRSRAGYLAIVGAIGLFVVAIEFSNQIPYMAMSNGFLLPAFVLAIFGLVNIRGWLSSCLSHPWMVVLGESSYAVYLLHSPLWFYVSEICPAAAVWKWPLYLLALQICSLAAFYLLERPARTRILRLANVVPRVNQELEKAVPARSAR